MICACRSFKLISWLTSWALQESPSHTQLNSNGEYCGEAHIRAAKWKQWFWARIFSTLQHCKRFRNSNQCPVIDIWSTINQINYNQIVSWSYVNLKPWCFNEISSDLVFLFACKLIGITLSLWHVLVLIHTFNCKSTSDLLELSSSSSSSSSINPFLTMLIDAWAYSVLN